MNKRIAIISIMSLLIATTTFAAVFPGAIDSFVTSVAGTPVSSADINNVKSAVVALETKVGIDGSAVATSIDYLLKNAASANPGHTHTGVSISALDAADITTGTLPLVRGGTGASLVIGPANSFLQSDGAAVVFGTNGSSLNFLNASNITSGTLADARLSANVALLDAIQTFSAANTFSAVGTAVSITNNLLVGGNITAPIIYGGTGASSTLSLRGTSNGAPVNAHIILNGSGQGFVGIGITPTVMLDMQGDQVKHNRVSGSFGPVWVATRNGTEVGRLAWDNTGVFDISVGAGPTLGLRINNSTQAVHMPGTGGVQISGNGTTPAPSAVLNVGPANEFVVDINGDLIRINDVPYTWPALQGAVSTILLNDGAGNLSWSTPAAFNVAWSSLIAPIANLSIAHSSYTTTFTWGSTTGVNNLFTLADSDNNTGTGYLLTLDTGTASTLNLFRIIADATTVFTVAANGDVAVDTNLIFADVSTDRVGIKQLNPEMDFEVGNSGTSVDSGTHIAESATNTGIWRWKTGTGAPAATNIFAQFIGTIEQADPSALQGSVVLQVNTGDTLTTVATWDGSQSAGNARTVLEDDAIGPAEIDDGTCDTVISVVYNPTEAGATDDYVSLNEIDTGTGEASFSTTETNENSFIVPVGMVANNLRADIDVAPGVGNDDWRITIRDDTASTSSTCDISEATTSCTDTSNKPAIAGGSRINLLVNSDVGGGADPTAASELVISFCLTHD